MYRFLLFFVGVFCYTSSYAQAMSTQDFREIIDLKMEVVKTKNVKRIFDFYNVVLSDGVKINIRDFNHGLKSGYADTSHSFDKKGYMEHEVDFYESLNILSYDLYIQDINHVKSSNRSVIKYVLKMNTSEQLDGDMAGVIRERKIKATCRDIYFVRELSFSLLQRDCTRRNDYSID